MIYGSIAITVITYGTFQSIQRIVILSSMAHNINPTNRDFLRSTPSALSSPTLSPLARPPSRPATPSCPKSRGRWTRFRRRRWERWEGLNRRARNSRYNNCSISMLKNLGFISNDEVVQGMHDKRRIVSL